MALESATYINGLVPTNPLGSDALAFADDHLRLIKSTIKNTFPNITGPVVWNQDYINNMMPIGAVIMWTGVTVPPGWALCNGQTVARTDGAGNITTPNLLDRFVIGAGNTYPLLQAGGSAFINLDVTQMPSHNHDAWTDNPGDHNHAVIGVTGAVGDHTHNLPNLGSVQAGSDNGGANVPVNTGYSSGRFQNATNGAGAHTHDVSIVSQGAGNHTHAVGVGTRGNGAAIDIRNPYYALYYIMKY
jgi:microcystin-dependent protein